MSHAIVALMAALIPTVAFWRLLVVSRKELAKERAISKATIAAYESGARELVDHYEKERLRRVVFPRTFGRYTQGGSA